MGYATTLYAVDLEKLQAAIGSRDAGLIERALATGGPAEIDPTQGPRIKVTRDSQIVLNGRPVSVEELRADLQEARWSGRNVYWYHERGQKKGVFSEAGSFMQTLRSALQGTRVAGILSCSSEEELIAGWDGGDELSEEQAVAELVAGTFSRTDCSYGYGLERLCQVLGTRLGVFAGKGRLKALKLDRPLAEPRPPVSLPTGEEFPLISHLTSGEVRQEVARLESLDLAFPKTPAIEQDRRALLQFLRTAAEQGCAVVSFYY